MLSIPLLRYHIEPYLKIFLQVDTITLDTINPSCGNESGLKILMDRGHVTHKCLMTEDPKSFLLVQSCTSFGHPRWYVTSIRNNVPIRPF